ncbi:MAG: hypothetical protein AAGK32_16785, partial [Actinomycetota bacterium]
MQLGAVLTATELEGVHPAADWSRWVRRGRAPRPDDALTDAFATGWADDLDQLVSLGMTEVLLTLEWAQWMPSRWGTQPSTRSPKCSPIQSM